MSNVKRQRTPTEIAAFRAALDDYHQRGWPIFPCKQGTKEPRDTGWQDKTYAPADFGDQDNVAIKVSLHWTDLDLDSVEAVEAADLILPQPGVADGGVYGRAGKPRSHRLRRGDGQPLAYEHYKDVTVVDANGRKKAYGLLEVRTLAKSTQKVKVTVLPPSIHASGEVYEWEPGCGPDAIASIPNDHTALQGLSLALAALFGRHWPAQSTRHDFAGHLAGMLCQHGLDLRWVHRVVKAAATLGRDPEVQDRHTIAASTVRTFDDGQPVTGAPHVAEIAGDEVVKLAKKWLKVPERKADGDVPDITADLEQMNERHFFTMMGTKSVIGSFTRDKDGQIPFVRSAELKQLYSNRRVVTVDLLGKAHDRSLLEAWVDWPGRRAFEEVVFAPPPLQTREGQFNLWKDFPVEAVAPTPVMPHEMELFTRGQHVPGRCYRILHHLRHVIANDDPAYYEVILNWLARMVQYPGEVAGSSHVWLSGEGAGKNVMIAIICALFHKSMTFSGPSDLIVGRFNACTRNRIFINVNESDGKKLKRNFDRVKMIITEERSYLELKGVDAYPIDNFAHVIFTTNPDEATGSVDLPAHVGQRRLVFQRINDRYAEGHCPAAERKAYFDPLFAELRDERSLGSFLWFLQHRDLSDYDPYAKLVTDEEMKQRKLTMTGPKRWLWDLVAAGQMPNAAAVPADADLSPAKGSVREVSATSVYNLYAEWASRHGETLVGIGPWGKLVNAYLWENGTRHTNAGNVGVLVSIQELEKRLRTASDPKTEYDEAIWSDGRRTTLTREQSTAINKRLR